MTIYFGKKTNAFVACPDMTDCTAHWRVNQPLAEIERDDPLFHTERLDHMTQSSMSMWELERSHFLFHQRPFSRPNAQLVHFSKTLMKPLWVDYDDNLWEVPRVNPANEFYGQAAQDIARVCLQDASAASISTPYLANYIHDKVAPDAQIEIVPNAIPDSYTWKPLNQGKHVLYRGGRTHVADLMSVTPDLDEIMDEFPDWTFHFCGNDPWMIRPRENMRVHPMRHIHEFHRWLYASEFSAMIVPLVDCPFNRSKSNISWIEGTYAGAAVLAPDFEEFRVPGCLRYQDGAFGDALRSLLSTAQDKRDALVLESRRVIDAKYRLSVVNPLRVKIMQELAS